ncbi:MAG: hypothetical protein NZ840_11985 [Anaerolineales bacterium]|nr:hypothetical protein [Anaerolineales bacterium]MDW8162754.1 hypothetical protein [Anaerolineales bacterium]
MRHILSFITEKRLGLLLFVSIVGFFLGACSPPRTIGFQGRLTDASGNPINGTKSMTVKLWTCAAGTGIGCNVAFQQTFPSVNVSNGLFNLEIGAGSSDTYGLEGVDPAQFAQPLWLELTIDGQTLIPRQKLLSAPYAMSLAGGSVVVSTHEGDGNTGSGDTDTTDINYGSLSVVAPSGGTALLVGVAPGTGSGDLIRGCSSTTTNLTTRTCPDLEFRVTRTGNVSADGTIAGGGADFAELIAVDPQAGQVEPGDVLVISPRLDRAVTLAKEPYSTAIAGVYSTQPGFIGGGGAEETSDNRIPVAIVGIVPVKVSAENGPIERGDLLTSASLPGHAMKATEYIPGAILGKAMGELESGTGVILVLLLLK